VIGLYILQLSGQAQPHIHRIDIFRHSGALLNAAASQLSMPLNLNAQWVIASMSFIAAAFSLNNLVNSTLAILIPPGDGEHHTRLLFWGIATAASAAMFIFLRLYILDPDGVRAKKEFIVAQHAIAEAEAQMHTMDMYDSGYRKKWIGRQLRRS
jgi:hypothetical protein